jgi:two-component system sensor histidine kinase/response regulator
MDLITHQKGKRRFVKYYMINLISITCLLICLYIFLPENIQKSLSVGLYLLSALSGLAIGTLIAKMISLKQKLSEEKEIFEKKNENLHTYLGNVVHDLRSPAASINMISELLESDLNDVTPQFKELISSIRKSSSGMLDRICCILDNTRIEKGIKIEEISAGNPYEIIVLAIKKHQIFAIEKNINIRLNIKKDMSNVYFDKDALDSIFCNLISNAIKYSMPNSTVRITSFVEKGKITFTVKDEGLGMNNDDLKRVFGEFAKLSARPTGNELSSGLGLSIVKKMTEQMGGEVHAYSEGINKGSTFSFSLITTAIVKTMTA